MSSILEKYQKAYVLMQLLAGENYTLAKAEVNIINMKTRRALGLDKKNIELNQLRVELCQQGLIEKSRGKTAKGGTADFFTLTEKGLSVLLTLEQYPGLITASGKAINALLQMKTVASTTTAQPKQISTAILSQEALTKIVMEIFQELLQEKFTRIKMVPIYALRRMIKTQYGEENAKHSVLDSLLIQMHKDKKLALLANTDTRGIAADEIEDSIPQDNKTLFYIEEI